MLDDWLKAAAEVVDKLMPAVHAHQAALANLGRMEEKSKALSAKPLTHEPENCTTNEAAIEWLQAINLDCLRSQEALEQIEEAQVEAKKLEKQVNDLWLQLFYKHRQAENWELYRAPESFHRQLSLIGLLVDRLDNTYGVLAKIKKDFQASEKPKPSFWSRAKQAAQHARDEEDTKDNTPDSTQKAAPNCGELLQAAAALLSKALVSLVSIEERKAHALSLQRIYSQKVQDPPLKGPTSPDSALVDDLLDTIETWAGERYTAQLNAAAMAVTLYDHLVALGGYLEEMQAHISGWQDLPKTREEAIQAHATAMLGELVNMVRFVEFSPFEHGILRVQIRWQNHRSPSRRESGYELDRQVFVGVMMRLLLCQQEDFRWHTVLAGQTGGDFAVAQRVGAVVRDDLEWQMQ
jgi:hypothetical protein